MTQDLRFAWRMIRTHCWFSAAVIATLALGIGLNTTVFAIVDAVLFKPVPVPGGERLVSVLMRDTKSTRRDRQHIPVSWPDFEYYRAHSTSLAALEAGSDDGAIVSEKDVAPEHYRMFRITPGFFRMLHIAPIRGRDLTNADAKSGAPPVVLIGYGVWQDRYGGRDVLGRMVRVDGVPAMVVGVMPEGLRFPNQEDVWMAFQAGPDELDRSKRSLQLFGMLKPGVTLDEAAAEFGVMSQRLADAWPKDDKNMAAQVQTFHQRYNGGEIQLVFLLMMGAVGLVLLIACANVANMLLGRALARRREISIRAAMGASRWQIARQLLVESVLMSAMGSVIGLAFARFGVHWFDLQTKDVGKPYWVQFTIDWRVFGYLALVCVLSALVFGLAPALRGSNAVNGALRDGARSTGSRSGGRMSGLLVIFQFGLTLVLLLGAAAFMKAFIQTETANPWIPADRLLVGRVTLPKERYKDAESNRRFFEQLLARLNAIPGVTGAAMVTDLPTTGASARRVEIEGAPATDKEHAPLAGVVEPSPGYLAALHLPLLRGRGFDTLDGSAGHLSAIVTRDLATRFWPGREPIGRRFRFLEKDKPGEWITVVGISANLEQELDVAGPPPLLFLPYREDSWNSAALVIPSAKPKAMIPAVRAAVASIDPDLPIFDVNTMSDFFAHQIWFLRAFGAVFTVFAATALLIAAVGIYAVMAQATGSRTREIGVRMALGATPRGILGLVLRRGALQLAAGVTAGIAVGIPATRAMRGLPFLGPSDPSMLAAVAALLGSIGLLACWLPARRAATINPVAAIREE